MEHVINNNTLVNEFVAAFEMRNADKIAPFLHEDIIFTNYGDAPVHGKAAVLKLWGAVFSMFGRVRFEILHQATADGTVLCEQIHHLAQTGREMAPIHNMTIYEIRDGLIAAWRDYTDSAEARRLLAAAGPISTAEGQGGS